MDNLLNQLLLFTIPFLTVGCPSDSEGSKSGTPPVIY